MENVFYFYYSDFMVGVRDLAVYFKTDDLLNVSFKPKYTVCRYILKKLLTLYWNQIDYIFSKTGRIHKTL